MRLLILAITLLSAAGQTRMTPDTNHELLQLFPPSNEIHIQDAADPAINGSWRTPGYWVLRSFPLGALVQQAIPTTPSRLDISPELPADRLYDVIFRPPTSTPDEERRDRLARALAQKFNLTLTRERRETDVLILTAPNGPAPLLERLPDPRGLGFRSGGIGMGGNAISVHAVTMSVFCEMLEFAQRAIVVDETNLPGVYNWTTNPTPAESRLDFKEFLYQKTGLLLAPARRPVEFVVVRPHRD